MKHHRCVLALEDGTAVRGDSFGTEVPVFGELVFNTGMTGYQEALTDPSYAGQILMMTYPLIGNYGVNDQNFESPRVQVRGFVVREACKRPSHRSSEMTIHDFLKRNGIPGIEGVDTRALTKKTRVFGTLRAFMVPYKEKEGPDMDHIFGELKKRPYPDADNLVATVSCEENEELPGPGGDDPTVLLIDCGVKANIIRNLRRFAKVIRAPYNITEDEIRVLRPDGILVSNGPGDPAHSEMMENTVATIRAVMSDYPIMGICLGHQLLALAFGGETYKLKFGHRGGNQPVRNVDTRKVAITSQNHGFAVKADTLPSEVKVLEENVNDDTVEAMEHNELPIFSVQYHPEASPGPRDTRNLFERFRMMMVSR